MSKTVNLEDVISVLQNSGITEPFIYELLQSLPSESKEGWIGVDTPPPILSNDIWYQCAVNEEIVLVACTYSKYGFTPYGSAQEDGRITHYRKLGKGPTK